MDETNGISELQALLHEAEAEHRRRFEWKAEWGDWLALGAGFLAGALAILILGLSEGFLAILVFAAFLLPGWLRIRKRLARAGEFYWIELLRSGEYFLSLRPFSRDIVPGKRSAVPEAALKQFGLIGTLATAFSRNRTMGEVLAQAVEARGSILVAIGNPQDWLPPEGLRTLYPGSNWQEAVVSLAKHAKGVVFETGNTAGLTWELARIRQEVSPSRVFILTSIDNDERGPWTKTQETLQAAGWKIPPDFPGQGSLIGFEQDGQARLLGHDLEEDGLASLLIAATLPERIGEVPSAWPSEPGQDRRSTEIAPHSEAPKPEASWIWDPRSGDQGAVPSRDRVSDWTAGMQRDIFSGGPAGCILVWVCLFVAIGVATLIGRGLYSAHASNPGRGGALILAIPAVLAGYLVHLMLSPVASRVAERVTSQRARRVGWGVAIGLPIWILLIMGLIRGCDRLQEPHRVAERLEKDCTEAASKAQLTELSACLAEARKLPARYPRRIEPDWLPKTYASVSLALQAGWQPIVDAALSHPKAYTQLDQILESLSLPSLRSQLSLAAETRLKELKQRGILVEFEMIEDGNLIREPEGTTVSKSRDSFLQCLAASTNRAILYSEWPLMMGSHEEDGVATLKLSVWAVSQTFEITGEGESSELGVPVLAEAALTSSESEITLSTEELPLKHPLADVLKDMKGLEDVEDLPWPLEDLQKTRSEHIHTLFSVLCEQLKSKETGAWIESDLH